MDNQNQNKDPIILVLISVGLLIFLLTRRKGVAKQCNQCQSTLPADIVYTMQPRQVGTGSLSTTRNVEEIQQPRVLYKNTEELTMVRDPETQRIEKVVRKITVTENE